MYSRKTHTIKEKSAQNVCTIYFFFVSLPRIALTAKKPIMAPNRQQTREERFQLTKLRKEKLASFYYDLAKLSFGGLVIGVLQILFTKGHLDISSLPVLLVGALVTFVFAVIAYTTIE